MISLEEAYLIGIHIIQSAEGQKEELDMTTGAALSGTPEDYTIIYTDSTGDLAGTVTKVHVKDRRRITIKREGDYQTSLVLEPNVRHQTLYQTPYGEFMIGVCALRVESQITQSGGTLLFRYCTDADMVPLGEVEFKMTLKPRFNGGTP